METLIKLKPSELNADLLKKLKAFAEGFSGAEITIRVTLPEETFLYIETEEEANARIEASIKELETGEGVSFTVQGFDELIAKLQKDNAA